jgi:hypothetical protein
MTFNNATIPWRERAFVSIDQAGQILGRSPTWIRKRVIGRRLEAARLRDGGKMVITVASIIEFLKTVETVDPNCVTAGQPKLRLVHSNT